MAVIAGSRRRSVVRPSLVVTLGVLAAMVTMHLALAAAPATVRVPDVTSLPLDRARHQLEDIGLVVATDGEHTPVRPQDWTVVAQSAPPGSAAADGERVMLSIDLTPSGTGSGGANAADPAAAESGDGPADPAAGSGAEPSATIDAPLAWVQQQYRGVDWLVVLTRTEPHDAELWVHTGLSAADSAAGPIEAVCNAFAAYQILELGGLRGVVVLAVDGQPLASRLAADATCADDLG